MMTMSEMDCASDWSIEAKDCDELTGRFTLGLLKSCSPCVNLPVVNGWKYFKVRKELYQTYLDWRSRWLGGFWAGVVDITVKLLSGWIFIIGFQWP